MSTCGGVPSPISSPLWSIGASSFSPSPITTTPSMWIVCSTACMPSTAAWSAASLSPRPIQRALRQRGGLGHAHELEREVAVRRDLQLTPPAAGRIDRDYLARGIASANGCRRAISVTGTDGRARCRWGASTPDYVRYHDEEWGRPVRDADALLREALPRGVPVRPLVADDPAQARALPRGVRRLRDRSRGALRRRTTSSG